VSGPLEHILHRAQSPEYYRVSRMTSKTEVKPTKFHSFVEILDIVWPQDNECLFGLYTCEHKNRLYLA
jgi:hypothetical protein